MQVQTATFMFTDLVGSTASAAALSPADADELRRTHLGILRTEVEAANGVEVKNLGDGIMAVFSSATSALAAAVALQQAVDHHNRRSTHRLAVRVGIATGEATRENDDFFGDPVVEAARLCARAEGGQILCAEVTRVLAARHTHQDFADAGLLELKGIPAPVHAYDVLWDPVDVEAGQARLLPARLTSAATQPAFAFRGRDDELETIEGVCKSAFNNAQLHTVLLAGEPGIGKTTLAAHAARSAYDTGATLLYGSCTDGLAVPYEPWIAALTDLLAHDDTDVTTLHPTHAGALRRLLPVAAGRLPAGDDISDPATEKLLLHEAVTALVAAAAAHGPVLIVLDDLHWADAASLQQLRHLVMSPLSMQAVILATFRDSDVAAGSPLAELLADLHRSGRVQRLKLDGLSDIDVVDLVEEAAGGQLSQQGVELAQAVWRESDGNPFFVGELLRHLGETDAVRRDASGRYALQDSTVALRLPTSVREVVERRVARLGDEAVRILSISALVGRSFDLDLVAAVARVPEEEVLDTFERATAASIVVEDAASVDCYRFVHALTGHVLEEGLSAARRRRIHEQIAIALEAAGSDSDSPQANAELARHWLAAVRPADSTKARLYATRAGDAALEALAPDDACQWYERALELVGTADDAERCRVLIKLADARRQAGDPRGVDAMLEASRLALALGHRDLLVGAALVFRDTTESQSTPQPERIAVMEAAVEAVGDNDAALRARLLAHLSSVVDPRDRRRAVVAEEAVETARRSGDDGAMLDAIVSTADSRATPDNLDARLEDGALGLTLAGGTRDIWLRAQALNAHVTFLLEAGRFDEGERLLRDLESIASETRLPVVANMGRLMRTALIILEGDLEAADAAVHATYEVGSKAGMANAAAAYGVQLLEVREQQGRIREVVDFYEEIMRSNPSIAAMRARVAELYTIVGRQEEAAELLTHDLANRFEAYPYNITWLGAMTRCSEIATTLRHREASVMLIDLLAPYVDRIMFNVVVVGGPVSRPLARLAAVLGREDKALRYFERALATVRSWQAPFWTARVLTDRAEFVPAHPGREADLEEAAVLAARGGYEGLHERLAALSS